MRIDGTTWRPLAAAWVLLALVVGTGHGPARAQEPASIEYWHINSATFGADAVKQSVAAFEAGQRSYGGLLNKLRAALAARKPPAVAQMGYNFRLFALAELPHTPLADFARDDPGYARWIEGFDPSVLKLGQDRAARGARGIMPSCQEWAR